MQVDSILTFILTRYAGTEIIGMPVIDPNNTCHHYYAVEQELSSMEGLERIQVTGDIIPAQSLLGMFCS